MSANSPVNISLDLDKSKIFDDPVRNIVPFNSLIICSENLERFSLDSEAALRNGYAIAHIFAPSDIHFAISRPFRMPPDAINGSSIELRTSIKLKAVGIPQSQNNSPRCSLISFFTLLALIFSIPAQLVPPDPAILIKRTFAFSSFI